MARPQNKAKQALVPLLATLTLASPISRSDKDGGDGAREAQSTSHTDKPNDGAKKAEPTAKKTEPIVITITLFEDDQIQPKKRISQPPENDLLDDIRQLLKLSDAEEKELLRLIRNEEFEKAQEFLEKLLEQQNIVIRYVRTKKPPATDSEYAGVDVVVSNDWVNAENNTITAGNDGILLYPPPSCTDTTQRTPNLEEVKRREEMRQQIEIETKAKQWLEYIDTARRAKKGGEIQL